MMNKYDEAIDYLTKNPDEIWPAWVSPKDHVAGCLFDFVVSGVCLTMIRGNPSAFKDTHAEIVADARIPAAVSLITVEDLPVFAEWQRKLTNDDT